LNVERWTLKVERLPILVIALSISVLLSSCGKQASAPPPRPTVAPGTGIVRGVVKFIGTPPPMRIIGGECTPGSTPAADESLLVNSDGSMRNIVVFIKDGPNIAGPPLGDAQLTQKNCQYEPHVQAIRTGQNMVVTSQDATVHNVHVEADANPAQNFSESINDKHPVSFAFPEVVRFKCDVHPWMTAYAYVFDHPCFAVTGDDGKFEIDHLPPGTYTLVAWQEKLLTQEMQVTVPADKAADVTIEYKGQ
jgi:Polysaccharide lyase family 4, domain II